MPTGEEKKSAPPATGAAASAPCGGSTPCPAPSGPPPCPPPDKWLADALAVMCPKDKAFLDDLRARGVTITAFDRIFWDDPFYDGTKWTTKRFEGGGSTTGTHMNIVIKDTDSKGVQTDIPPDDVAATIYHEGIHTGQPSSMSWSEKEYEAYTKGEQWAIDHGKPESRPGFRTKDASGKPIPNKKAIRDFVDKEYPIATDKPSKPGTPPDRVIGKTSKGDTIMQRADGSTYNRPPKKGDTFAGPQVEEPPGGRPAETCQLKCP